MVFLCADDVASGIKKSFPRRRRKDNVQAAIGKLGDIVFYSAAQELREHGKCSCTENSELLGSRKSVVGGMPQTWITKNLVGKQRIEMFNAAKLGGRLERDARRVLLEIDETSSLIHTTEPT